jgi:hypothetical protein
MIAKQGQNRAVCGMPHKKILPLVNNGRINLEELACRKPER